MRHIQIEPDGSHDSGACDCCGQATRRVWGFASESGADVAAYFVRWTPGRILDHGASFDLVVNELEGTASADRSAVSLLYRLTDDGPQFMVVDAEGRLRNPDLAPRELSRDEVIGRPIADLAFALVDAILEQDPRVLELLGPHRLVPAKPIAPPKRPRWRFW